MSGQFGSFDGKDNRRDVLGLFARLSFGVPESIASLRRKMFLEELAGLSGNGFADKNVVITPCSAVEAYFIFVGLTGCMGVPIEEAAIRLEKFVVQQQRCPGIT